ncbi:hypothetical protein [Pseudomonas fluorescens]|uniref:hypothetical protein n=1 Tax=Pseudomonas fluorescens TaxID=294 RepID=UPI001241F975|nr:hypothetical protein [Pseudomonas fluorescens]
MTFVDLVLGERYSIGEANLLTTLPPRKPNPGGVTRSYPKFIAYFACYDDYYNLQIRGPAYFGNYISKNADGQLGAFPAAGGDTTSFNLLDDNKTIITLDNLGSGIASVYLKARSGGVIKSTQKTASRRESHSFNDRSGDAFKFNIEILERNVGYPGGTRPDEYNDFFDVD